jgi:murein DD-endopeptidase MepM/ murein hydrolase activator NlpD
MNGLRLGLALAAVVLSVPALEKLQSLSIAGAPVELIFRALQPGEAILVKAKADPAIKSVVLKFRKQTRRIEIVSGMEAAALFGIDVDTIPGPYPLETSVERLDGSIQTITRELVVERKEFPKSEISLDPKLLVPPPGEAERVKREAELVAAVLSVVSPEWLATEGFESPLPDLEPYPNFGQRRIYNKTSRSTHAGVDIAAPSGTPARASNAGRVVLAAKLYLSGNTVIVDHGLGVFSYYCHFSKLLVKRGDLVRKGDQMALVGSTGRSTGPHLHWSLRLLDSRIDPFSLVALPLK